MRKSKLKQAIILALMGVVFSVQMPSSEAMMVGTSHTSTNPAHVTNTTVSVPIIHNSSTKTTRYYSKEHQRIVERSERRSYEVGVAVDVANLIPAISNDGALKKHLAAPKTVSDIDPSNLENGVLAKVKSKGKWGILNTEGKEIVVPQYKKLEPLGKGQFVVQDDKKNPIYLDAKGNPTESAPSYNGWTVFKEKGKYGFKDGEGNVVLPATYRQIITGFSEDRAFVKNAKGKRVAIDTKGNEIFNLDFEDVFPYENGLAEYRRPVHRFGLPGVVGLLAGGLIGGGLLVMTHDGAKRGYIDLQGNIVIDSKLDAVYPMTPYGTVIKDHGKVGFVDRKGKAVIEPNSDYSVGNMDLMTAIVSVKSKEKDKFGAFSMIDGKQVIPFEYDKLEFLGGNRLSAMVNEKQYLVDITTGHALKTLPKELSIGAYGNDNYAWSNIQNEQYQIIDLSGAIQYKAPDQLIEKVTPFNGGLAGVKSGGKWGLMDGKGRWVINPIYDEIQMI